MHSVIYRTQMLRDCGLELPKHTFYVDSIYVFNPMPYVKTMYYLNVDFYRYFIGRADQSVNEQVMIKRMDQQFRVNKLMLDKYDFWQIQNKKCRQYMLNYLEIITVVSSIMCLISGTEEHLKMKAELWQYIKEKDARLYKKLRYGIMGIAMNLPGKIGRKISIWLYHLAQGIVGFN